MLKPKNVFSNIDENVMLRIWELVWRSPHFILKIMLVKWRCKDIHSMWGLIWRYSHRGNEFRYIIIVKCSYPLRENSQILTFLQTMISQWICELWKNFRRSFLSIWTIAIRLWHWWALVSIIWADWETCIIIRSYIRRFYGSKYIRRIDTSEIKFLIIPL